LDDLDTLRDEVASIDEAIVDLMARRRDVALRIGRVKRSMGSPIRHPGVEERVRVRYRSLGSAQGIDAATCTNVADALIRECVDAQADDVPRDGCVRVLVIGGGGAMGGWLVRYLRARGNEVDVSDPSVPGSMSIEEGCSWAEAILVAAPISAIGGVLETIRVTGTDAIVADVASIKSPFLDELMRLADDGVSVCSLHPMFGPSVSSTYDRNLVVCPIVDGAAEFLESLFSDSGMNIVRRTVGEHDALMTWVLSLSHAINIVFLDVVRESGFAPDELLQVSSTTFRRLLASSLSVTGDNAALYHEIQALNPANDGMWDLLGRSVERLHGYAMDPDPSMFVETMGEGQENMRRVIGGPSWLWPPV